MSDRYPLRTHIQVRGHYCYHTGRSDKTSYVCLYLCTQHKGTDLFSFFQTQLIRAESKLFFYFFRKHPTIVAKMIGNEFSAFLIFDNYGHNHDFALVIVCVDNIVQIFN